MALTELQLPVKTDFYNKLSNAASEMDNLMNRWKNISEFIGFVGTADLDAMGVPAGAIRTDMVDFKTVLNLFVDCYYNGTAIDPTDIPAGVIDKIRRM